MSASAELKITHEKTKQAIRCLLASPGRLVSPVPAAEKENEEREGIMITQETAANIWSAYREIAAAEKLLSDMAEERGKPFQINDKYAATLKDAFGRRQHLQLGIPSGENSHRLYQVKPELAESVIRAHIGQMKAMLVEANECARVELNTPTP